MEIIKLYTEKIKKNKEAYNFVHSLRKEFGSIIRIKGENTSYIYFSILQRSCLTIYFYKDFEYIIFESLVDNRYYLHRSFEEFLNLIEDDKLKKHFLFNIDLFI